MPYGQGKDISDKLKKLGMPLDCRTTINSRELMTKAKMEGLAYIGLSGTGADEILYQTETEIRGKISLSSNEEFVLSLTYNPISGRNPDDSKIAFTEMNWSENVVNKWTSKQSGRVFYSYNVDFWEETWVDLNRLWSEKNYPIHIKIKIDDGYYEKIGVNMGKLVSLEEDLFRLEISNEEILNDAKKGVLKIIFAI